MPGERGGERSVGLHGQTGRCSIWDSTQRQSRNLQPRGGVEDGVHGRGTEEGDPWAAERGGRGGRRWVKSKRGGAGGGGGGGGAGAGAAMKGGTVSLMLVAILVPLGITLSLLLVSYTSSCTLANYGEVAASGYGVRYGRMRMRMRLGMPGCRKVMEGVRGRLPQHMSSSDVRHGRVKEVRIEGQDLAELRAASTEFDLSEPRVHQVLQLVKRFTEGWAPLEDRVGGSVRTRSAWSVRHVRDSIANTSSLLSCCAHFRVVGGKVFFRYAFHSMKSQYRLDRSNDAASFLQATVDRFRLRDVSVEFLFNTCDHALAREGMAEGDRSNFLVWSPHVTEELDADLAVPDMLDLRPSYMQSRDQMAEARASGRKWEDKIPKAVFRGATTNFWLRLSNWVSSPRLRLHRMTSGLGRMLDAKVTRWSHVPRPVIHELEENEGIRLGDRLDETRKNDFKYEMVVDGGLGGARLCGVLLTQRALILQDSPFIQFFYPLLKKGRHFMETDHFFQDLPEVLEYMQAHDGEMRDMVERVHKELGWTCSIDGRMLAFAVILVKYHAIQDPQFYKTGVPDEEHFKLTQAPSPEQRCTHGPATNSTLYKDLPSDSTRSCPYRPEPRVVSLPGCPSDCSQGLLEPDWRWLAADDLDGVAGTDWWKTYIPQS